MDPSKTTLERAFEIALSGVPTGMVDIRRQLQAEGYDDQKLEGRSLLKQLRKTLKEAKADA